MTWDYAMLSHLAKTNGGPAALINKIEQAAMAAGRKQMIPAVAGALVLGGSSVIVVQKVIELLNGRAKISPEAVSVAKEELIAGIESYDREHPNGDAAISNEMEALDGR